MANNRGTMAAPQAGQQRMLYDAAGNPVANPNAYRQVPSGQSNWNQNGGLVGALANPATAIPGYGQFYGGAAGGMGAYSPSSYEQPAGAYGMAQQRMSSQALLDSAKLNQQTQLASLPYTLASALGPAREQANAEMYSADRQSRAQEQSSYYNAAGQMGSTAINADATKYGDTLNQQTQLTALPYNLLATLQPARDNANASMYAANQAMQGQALASYYPAQAQVATAHYQPWASVQQARMGALAQQNSQQIAAEAALAQARLENERQLAQSQLDYNRSRQNLGDVLNFAGPYFQQAMQNRGGLGGFTTNYGAGYSWS